MDIRIFKKSRFWVVSFLLGAFFSQPAELFHAAFAGEIKIPAKITESSPACSTEASLPDMLERIAPGVVNISSTTIVHMNQRDEFMLFFGIPQERKQTSLGSGFIIDQEGYVLTNNHVVDQASEVVVTLSDKRQYKARIVGKDDKMDLAILQIRTPEMKVPKDLKYVPMGNSDQIRIGESVVAVGNPFGLQNTVSHGIISQKNRSIGMGPFDNFLQTDASINPGNSGGPLFNMKGEVIGVTTSIFSKTGQNIGLGFAIPSNEAKRLIPDLKQYGRVPRPWLGILAERMTPQLQHHYNLGTSKGVLVYNVVESAPADKAGLQQGDILIEVKGKLKSLQLDSADSSSRTHTNTAEVSGIETLEPYDVERALAKFKPKETVQIRFYREKKIREATVKLEELPRLDRLPRGII